MKYVLWCRSKGWDRDCLGEGVYLFCKTAIDLDSWQLWKIQIFNKGKNKFSSCLRPIQCQNHLPSLYFEGTSCWRISPILIPLDNKLWNYLWERDPCKTTYQGTL